MPGMGRPLLAPLMAVAATLPGAPVAQAASELGRIASG